MWYDLLMARKNGQGSKWIAKSSRLAIYLRDEFTCQYCGKSLKGAEPEEIGLDHLVCSSHGGSNGADNLITVCRSCNSSRGTRPWRDYAPGGAQERIEATLRKPLNRVLARAILSGNADWADR